MRAEFNLSSHCLSNFAFTYMYFLAYTKRLENVLKMIFSNLFVVSILPYYYLIRKHIHRKGKVRSISLQKVHRTKEGIIYTLLHDY